MFALVVAGLLIAGAVMADYLRSYPADAVATYIGRDSCAECHASETAAFTGSHHDLAMDLATDETVVGDFNDAIFEHDGLQNRLFRDGKKYMVHTEGPDGKMQDFEVKYVFGVDPLQQYMVEFDRDENTKDDEVGRVQVLRISWDTKNKNWFYLRPPDVPEKLEPDDPLHWTGVAQRWQTMCAECHSTNLKRNFDVATQEYHTTFSEIDVSCEACHGPASLHVEMARGKSLFWDRHLGFGLARLKGADSHPQIETCAPCHSRRGVLDGSFEGGNEFCNHYSLELLREDTYHADGQIKDEVYVYGSFVQSKMYHKGIRCTDCHDPHSLKLKHPGNETCTSCHQHPTGKYDIPSHHHHAVGSEGAKCVNCHMPHTTYMDVDARRDHSFRIPRPDLSVEIGTPNACSGCHVKDQLESLPEDKRDELTLYQDWLLLAQEGDEEVASAIAKTNQWCDEACEKWHGDARAQPTHYAEAFTALREGDRSGVQKALRLIALADDPLAPVIAKATALDELVQRGHREGIAAAKQLIDDDAKDPGKAEPLLLASAARAMSGSRPAVAKKTLLPLIVNSSRLVRSEAAKALVASGGYQSMIGREKKPVDAVLDDVKNELMYASDRAGSHMGWAMMSEQRSDFVEAIKAYQNAIAVEPKMTGARTNLAALLDQLAEPAGQSRQAAEVLSKINGMLGDSDVSDWAEQLRAEELPLLQRDAGLASENAAIQYRYGLALYLSGDLTNAQKQLQLAVELAPEVPDFQTALRLLSEKLSEKLDKSP